MNKEKAQELRNTYLKLHDMLLKANPGVNLMEARFLNNTVVGLLEDVYAQRYRKINLFEPYGIVCLNNLRATTVIVKDQIFKYSHDENEEESRRILYLLKARECDEEFEEKLAVRIVGDNEKFPYRTSSNITDFFRHHGFNEKHDGTTRRIWVAYTLKRYCIEDIYKIVSSGLFRKKYFIATGKDIGIALQDFKQMLEQCCVADEVYDISTVFDFNVNTDLLFEEQIKSADDTLNSLIDSSREFYIKGDIQFAVEKIWDALERSKTILNPENKKESISSTCKKCAVNLEETFFNNEYNTLTDVGNSYQIRHFETNKIKIDDIDTLKYLYFRAFVLVNYAIRKLELTEAPVI